MKVLLHTCCAPCGGGCIERLKNAGAEVRLYYSNSNLVSAEEFERRLESVRRLAEIFQLELEVDPYDHSAWLETVAGLEKEPEHGLRCARCFGFSLERTARRAREINWNFATTLTVSPYKFSKTVFEAAASFPEFLPFDFKKKDGFKRSCEIARLYDFYRQKFCGCEFSLPAEKVTGPSSESDAEHHSNNA